MKIWQPSNPPYMYPTITPTPVTTAPVIAQPVHAVVQSVWNSWDMPPHYKMSNKLYVSAHIKDMRDRGFKGSQVEALARMLPHDAVIAGGAVASSMLGEQANTDIDVFFLNGKAFEDTFNMLINPPQEGEDSWAFKGYTTNTTLEEIRKNSKEVRYVKFESSNPNHKPIQLIKMVWFDSVQHVIDSFDFTVCQFALSGDFMHYCPLGVIDLLKKRLQLNKMQFPAVSLRRLIKYTNKGFYAAPSVLLRIAEDIKNSDEIDPHQMVGKDY